MLRTVRRRRGREQGGLAARLHARAVADRDAGRLSPALAAGERALTIVEHGPGEFSVDAAVVWNTIGTIREAMCDYDGAGSAYRRAAAILDRHQDDDTVVPARITVTSSSARLHRTSGRARLNLYLQHTKPGPQHEPNWLPAPLAPFGFTSGCTPRNVKYSPASGIHHPCTRRSRPRSLKHPRFHAHLVTCDRCAFRRGVERSTRPRLPRVGVARAGA